MTSPCQYDILLLLPYDQACYSCKQFHNGQIVLSPNTWSHPSYSDSLYWVRHGLWFLCQFVLFTCFSTTLCYLGYPPFSFTHKMETFHWLNQDFFSFLQSSYTMPILLLSILFNTHPFGILYIKLLFTVDLFNLIIYIVQNIIASTQLSTFGRIGSIWKVQNWKRTFYVHNYISLSHLFGF